MAQYFSKITADHWKAKNRLQKAAQEVARKMDRRLIPGDQVKRFNEQFTKMILETNQAYPRCKPLELYIEPSLSNKEEWFISIDRVFQLSLYKVKECWLGE